MFSQKPKQIRSVASDDLTKYFQAMVSLNMNKNSANQLFWNLFIYQSQGSPKLIGILTVLRCIFDPNLEILNSIGLEVWHGQFKMG